MSASSNHPKDQNVILLKHFRSAHDSGVPAPLANFISGGNLAAHEPFSFKDRSGRAYKGNFIKDIAHRMDGMADQAIRIAVSEEAGDTEPIGFADMEPADGDDGHLYQLIVFPKYLMNSLDAEDPCPVYLVKYKGHPENDECYEDEEDEDSEDHEEEDEADDIDDKTDEDGSFKCAIEEIAPDFKAFMALIA